MVERRDFLSWSAGAATTALLAGNARSATGAPARIDVLAAIARKELAAPGVVYGAVAGGRVVVRKGLGVKTLGKEALVLPTTVFHMASVTKPFVATAIARRVEQKTLRLDRRLYDVLPEFRIADPRAASITIEQVLTHSAGFRDVTDYEWEKPQKDEGALKRYLAGLSDSTLLFAPGTAFEYSNIGYEVLARVIEVIDGTSFEAAVKRTILEPLKMNRSTLFYPAADRSQLATPHTLAKDGKVSVSSVFPYNRRHAGSSTLLSCVDDMLRWIQANLNDGVLEGVRIMSANTARDLRTPRPVQIREGSFPPGAKPALSWFVIPRTGREVIAHGGTDLGFVSICLFSPKDNCGVVAMANCLGEQSSGPLLRFAMAVIDEELLAKPV